MFRARIRSVIGGLALVALVASAAAAQPARRTKPLDKHGHRVHVLRDDDGKIVRVRFDDHGRLHRVTLDKQGRPVRDEGAVFAARDTTPLPPATTTPAAPAPAPRPAH